MRRSSGVLAMGMLLLVACVACVGASVPRMQTGPAADRTPDGLHKVDNVVHGTLFMKPDYAFGAYHQFVLGRTNVTFERGSRVLDERELASLTSIFEDVARGAIKSGGRTEAAKPGVCIALVNLGLVDLEIVKGASSGGVDSFGAVTLVLEIRDGHTREALLRYGQRRRLGGGTGGVGIASLRSAFKRFAVAFQKDFNRSLPPADPARKTLDCTERARTSA